MSRGWGAKGLGALVVLGLCCGALLLSGVGLRAESSGLRAELLASDAGSEHILFPEAPPARSSLTTVDTERDNDYGTYDPRNDPWLKEDHGSLSLWAESYALKHGDGKKSGPGYGDHGLYSLSAEPDPENKKNGWERYDFLKWLNDQGGDANEFWQDRGFPTVGSEYALAFTRMGIRSKAALKASDPEDVPMFPGCEYEEGGDHSAHAYCGELGTFVEDAKAPKLWLADHKGMLKAKEIRKRLAKVRESVRNMVPKLTGTVPFDDKFFYCYSKFPEDPEYSQCLAEMKFSVDPVSGQGPKDKSWKQVTKGLWPRHADGSPVEGGESTMGQSWSQLTRGLWHKTPYKERNALNY